MADELEGRIQEIEKSVDTLESRMREQLARTESGTRVVLVVGIILVIFVFGYLTWMSRKVKDLAKPTDLAMILEGEANKHLPKLIQDLENTLRQEAPDHVKTVRETLVGKLPAIREEAQKVVVAGLDGYADQLDTKVDQIVIDLMKENKESLTPLIEAAASEGGPEALKKAFQDSLENLVGKKMDEVLVEFNRAMTIVEVRLDRYLVDDDKLSPDLLWEKELIQRLLLFLDEVAQTEAEAVPMPPA